MTRLAHGIDIVEIDRIDKLLADHGERFLSRVFTPSERDYCSACRRPAVRYAGRFAAKEALLKLLGTGWRGGIAWTDMEVLNDPLGKPLVRLQGACARRAAELDLSGFDVSISHAGAFAVASAVAISVSPPGATPPPRPSAPTTTVR